MQECWKMETTRNILIGGFFRNTAACIVTYYLPVFFGKNYPAMKTSYSIYNAMVLSIGGIIASITSGIVSDKFEAKTTWTKALILMIMQGLSLPCILASTIYFKSFWPSFWCYAAYQFISSTYVGPAVTMMQNTAPPNQQGNIVSAWFFSMTIAQTISPFIFGNIANYVGVVANPKLYGPLIAIFATFGYSLCIPFWYKAGKGYTKYMKQQKER
jgi:MFS family permease